MFVDNGSSVDIMFMDCFKKMKSIVVEVQPVGTSSFGFAGESIRVFEKVSLHVVLGEREWKQN